ncbi:MAG: hypothetical protein IJY35_09295 [Clostridia bacterium]|nr:hypothetical protein [Clostridia bacterium]
MKKLTAILLALALVSCTKTDDIAAGLETYREVYDSGSSAPAEVPLYMDGIESPDFYISGGKYYFMVSRRITRPSGTGTATETNHMLAYMDSASGNAAYACSDPLCRHVTEEECRFANLRECRFTETPGVFYGFRESGLLGRTIWLADLNEGTSRPMHEVSWMSSAVGYENGKLYFYEWEEITQGRQTVNVYTYCTLDHETGEVTETGRLPDDWPYRRKSADLVLNGELYFMTDDALVKTDAQFETAVELAELPAPVVQWYLDRNTGELFLLTGDRDTFTGSLYVLRNGELMPLTLTHEEICSFSITEDRIYYTAYDPVYYGTSSLGQLSESLAETPKTYDYTGGRVYAADRGNPSGKSEMVYEADGFDQNHMAYLKEFAVVGDSLYFKEVTLSRQVIDGAESITISHPGAARIRVGLKDGSFTRIAFE